MFEIGEHLVVGCDKSLQKFYDRFSKKKKKKNSVRDIKDGLVVLDKVGDLGGEKFPGYHNNFVPKKVEVFIWRARKKRLPALCELDKRGIDLNSVQCQLCDDDIETVEHALVFCKHVIEIWEKVFDWWGVKLLSSISINELFQGPSNIAMSDFGIKLWQAITWTSGYLIWHNRNQKIFNNKSWNPPIALCEIQLKSFEWVAKRCREKKIEWHNWIHNPHIFLV
ncbi:uncharacterized protein [Rutidosis leptorrhynchoides]|uniref:uncharacterized protein n=1 Tax=Rutidosis leptorrhynchoides TaxID=125765 RepID=UPI003A996C9C